MTASIIRKEPDVNYQEGLPKYNIDITRELEANLQEDERMLHSYIDGVNIVIEPDVYYLKGRHKK